ncbi:hypothetical protein PMIN04_002543 [Paraphaeosphaeria minitans]
MSCIRLPYTFSQCLPTPGQPSNSGSIPCAVLTLNMGQEQSTPELPPPPQGSASAEPPPVLPYDPHAQACNDCDHPARTIHVITHECLEGDALRCVIKPVRDDVPLELDDYVRAGDLLNYLEAAPPPEDDLPPPPPPPASSSAGQPFGSPTVLTITATPSGDSTTITTTYTLPPQPSLYPGFSSPRSSSAAPVTTITSKITVGSTVLPISTTIFVGSSSFVVVPIGSRTVPIVSYTTYSTTTSSCPVSAATSKTIVSTVPTAASSFIVVTATLLSGPPITTTIAVPVGSTKAGQIMTVPNAAASATLLPPMSTVLRPPGGWSFQLSSSRSNDRLRPTAWGAPPQGSHVASAPGMTSSASAPAGRPTEFVLGGTAGMFGSPASSPGAAVATDAAARLIAAAQQGGGRVADTQYKRSEAPGHSATTGEPERDGEHSPWDVKKDLEIRGTARLGGSPIQLTPNIARIVLGDGQTLNPNAKLLRKLRAQKLIPGPEDVEPERRGAVGGQDGEHSPEQSAVKVGDGFVGSEGWGLTMGMGEGLVKRVEEERMDMSMALFVVSVLCLVICTTGGGMWALRRWKGRTAA